MDSMLNNKNLKINGWLRELTFPKFMVTMIIFGALFYFQTNNHMANANIHLNTEKEQTAMSLITQYDMTYGANLAVLKLQHEIDAIKVILAQYESDGKLQSPAQKKALILDVIKEYERQKNRN